MAESVQLQVLSSPPSTDGSHRLLDSFVAPAHPPPPVLSAVSDPGPRPIPAPSPAPIPVTASANAPAISSPPTDRGRTAYSVLAACALAQAPVWGYSLSFGVFQQYYAAHGLRDASPAAVAAIGTSQTGVLYLAVPVVLAVLTRFPGLRRWSGPVGLAVAAISLASSSAPGAADQAADLIATQGVLYAVGCALQFGPASLSLDDWFVARKGLATGVMWASKSLVGVAMPLLMAVLLAHLGLAATLRAWAVASVLLGMPALYFLRGRDPDVQQVQPGPAEGGRQTQPGQVDQSDQSDQPDQSAPPPQTPALIFFRRPFFWMLMIGNTVQSLGYQMPNTYLSSYAAALGYASSSSLIGPLLLALSSLASVPGSLVMGLLGDRLSATTVVLISSAGSALSVFALWYVSDAVAVAAAAQGSTTSSSAALGLIVAFVLAYGFFAGGFSSTWSAVLHDMRRRDAGANTGLVFGMLMGGRGIGFVLSGPVSGLLLQSAASSSPAAAAASTDSAPASAYSPLILCTGTTAILGAWGALWTLRKPCRRLARSIAAICRGR